MLCEIMDPDLDAAVVNNGSVSLLLCENMDTDPRYVLCEIINPNPRSVPCEIMDPDPRCFVK